MKKGFLLVAAMAFYLLGFGENKIEIIKDSFPNYQGIIHLEGKNKKEIYALLKEWVAINYKSSKSVVQLDDPENNKLIIKGNSDFSFYYLLYDRISTIEYSIIFDIKQGKFRYTIEILDVKEGTMSLLPYIEKRSPKKYINLILNGIDKNMNSLKQRLLELSVVKSDNW